MTVAVRLQAVALLREQEAAIRARRARLAERGQLDAAETLRAAEAMLPQLVATHGDTPTLQAARRAAMQTDHDGAESRRREARAA
ncbi:hypothetical protein [Oerskovia paurometabola]|uniref:hypothetical protein n=1 Tax=Oerskovia paurometabola TaxID=162170 RepID=UPI003808DF1D